jgi:hypothetical protein
MTDKAIKIIYIHHLDRPVAPPPNQAIHRPQPTHAPRTRSSARPAPRPTPHPRPRTLRMAHARPASSPTIKPLVGRMR